MAETGVTSEQLKDIVDANDVESTIGDALSDALDASGATFDDDPIPPKESEAEEVKAEEEEPPGDPDAKSDDAPGKESVPESKVAAKPPEDDGQEKTDQAKESDGEGAPSSLTPPGTWSAEEKSEFVDLPAKVQSAILRREGDRSRAFDQKQAEMNQTVQRYADMDRVLEPHMQGLALRGMTPATLLGQYIATSEALAKNPIETFKYLADQYGVDLSTINQAAPEEAPENAELRRELNEMRGVITQFQNSHDQQRSDLQTQRSTEMANKVKSFADTVDDAGNLKYPHFEELRKAMGTFVRAAGEEDQTMDLDEAYQRALWASPEHRTSLLANQNRERERKDEEERKAKAAKAAKAGKSVAGAPGGGEAPDPTLSVRESLEKNWVNSA